jgi:gamma-glutamylcyclotransferase (GGCT)/AIG2-like uncharacterized protein YtfP
VVFLVSERFENVTAAPIRVRFFACGTLLRGENHHARLEGATPLASLRTEDGYNLVEVGGLAALVEEGSGSVLGELYELDAPVFQRLAKQADHPGLFQLRSVRLSDGTRAESFFLETDQVRGKRRIHSGDFRARFGKKDADELHTAGPFVRWSRTRQR